MHSSAPDPERESPRVALVTGGASGIGLGISCALASEGWHIAVCGRRAPTEVAATIKLIDQNAPSVTYYRADISDPDHRERLVESLCRDFGRLDLLVNNAGVAPSRRGDLLDASVESFDRVLGINLKGSHFLTQLVARWMIEQGKTIDGFDGCIITITSVSAAVVSINRGDYCISKAGLSMSTALWAVRLAEYGIRVYEIRPGIILTEMTAPVKDTYDRLLANGLVPEARWGEPDDVGAAVATLARADIPYATGSIIHLDGGMSIQRL